MSTEIRNIYRQVRGLYSQADARRMILSPDQAASVLSSDQLVVSAALIKDFMRAFVRDVDKTNNIFANVNLEMRSSIDRLYALPDEQDLSHESFRTVLLASNLIETGLQSGERIYDLSTHRFADSDDVAKSRTTAVHFDARMLPCAAAIYQDAPI